MAAESFDYRQIIIGIMEDMLTKELQKIDSNLYARYEPVAPDEKSVAMSVLPDPSLPQPINSSSQPQPTNAQQYNRLNWTLPNSSAPMNILYQPTSAPANPNPIKLSTTAPEFVGTRAFFLVMDDPIPDHIQKTFGFGEKDGALKHYTDCPVIRMGETINLGRHIEFAVIIYQASDWHSEQAYQLLQQLRDLYPDLKVLSLPVGG